MQILDNLFASGVSYTNNGTGEHAVVRDPINSFRINSMVMVLAITSNIAQSYGRTCIDSRHMHVAKKYFTVSRAGLHGNEAFGYKKKCLLLAMLSVLLLMMHGLGAFHTYIASCTAIATCSKLYPPINR